MTYAGPRMAVRSSKAFLYATPDAASASGTLINQETFYILGAVGDWYHVWLPGTEAYSYIRQDALTAAGN